MILKRDLLSAIDLNTEQIVRQGQLIRRLEKRIGQLEKGTSAEKTIKVKKHPGHLRKVHVWTDEMNTCLGSQLASDILDKEIDKAKKALTKAKKSANAKKQPRDNGGKFAKKS